MMSQKTGSLAVNEQAKSSSVGKLMFVSICQAMHRWDVFAFSAAASRPAALFLPFLPRSLARFSLYCPIGGIGQFHGLARAGHL